MPPTEQNPTPTTLNPTLPPGLVYCAPVYATRHHIRMMLPLGATESALCGLRPQYWHEPALDYHPRGMVCTDCASEAKVWGKEQLREATRAQLRAAQTEGRMRP